MRSMNEKKAWCCTPMSPCLRVIGKCCHSTKTFIVSYVRSGWHENINSCSRNHYQLWPETWFIIKLCTIKEAPVKRDFIHHHHSACSGALLFLLRDTADSPQSSVSEYYARLLGIVDSCRQGSIGGGHWYKQKQYCDDHGWGSEEEETKQETESTDSDAPEGSLQNKEDWVLETEEWW